MGCIYQPWLTLFFPIFPFEGDQKRILGRKGLNERGMIFLIASYKGVKWNPSSVIISWSNGV